ncbi:MAG: hypothetical protein AB7F35_10490 [Acetobacteraceae bacterium]
MTDTSTKKTVRDIFYVKDDPNGGKGRWSKVGVAFENQDGKGHTICIDLLPRDPNWDGRLIIRDREER